MAEIIPSIIGKNYFEIADKLSQLETLVPWAQLDIMDGRLTPEASWQTADDLETTMGKIKLEVHLMVQEPEEVLTNWLRVADRVFVHQETLAEGAEKIFSQCQVARAHQLALALFLDTPLDVVEDYLPYIDSLLLLAVARPGFYGESLSEDFYARLTEAQGRWPQLSLVVDGGVKLSNAGQLVGAGADRLVVGSGLWQSGQELATTYQQFQTIVSAVGNF